MNKLKASADRRLSGIKMNDARARAILRAAKEDQVKLKRKTPAALLIAAAMTIFLVTGALAVSGSLGLFSGGQTDVLAAPSPLPRETAPSPAYTSVSNSMVNMELVSAICDGSMLRAQVKLSSAAPDAIFLYCPDLWERETPVDMWRVELNADDLSLTLDDSTPLEMGETEVASDGDALVFTARYYVGAAEAETLPIRLSLLNGAMELRADVPVDAEGARRVSLTDLNARVNDARVAKTLTIGFIEDRLYALMETEAAANSASAGGPWYATVNGLYYHTVRDCQGMTNAREYEDEAALQALGKQTCPFCAENAATASEASYDPELGPYYATDKGVYFHKEQYCMGMKDAGEYASAASLLARGQLPCLVCVAPETATAGEVNAGKVFRMALDNKEGDVMIVSEFVQSAKDAAGNEITLFLFPDAAGPDRFTDASVFWMDGFSDELSIQWRDLVFKCAATLPEKR